MTLSQPIVPQSLVEEAFERLADAIASGEIEPGERVREALLSRQLGVSRAVLREALQRLESLWLVARTPNVGVYVISPSQHDFYELYSMLEALQGLAARLAAAEMTPDEIAELGVLIDAEVDQDGVPCPTLDSEEFHCRIARGSRNARLERMVCHEFRYQLRFYRQRVTVRPGWEDAARAERKAVLDAIADGDGEAAEAAIRTHIRHWRANLLFSDTAATP